MHECVDKSNNHNGADDPVHYMLGSSNLLPLKENVRQCRPVRRSDVSRTHAVDSHISCFVGDDCLHDGVREQSRGEQKCRQDKLDKAFLRRVGHIESATSAVVVIRIAHHLRRHFA